MPVPSAPREAAQRAPGRRDASARDGAASDGTVPDGTVPDGTASHATAGSLRLRLYVAGMGPNSVRARTNLGALMARCGVRADALDVVDCLQEPRRALADGVLVTPTLVRVAPGPRQVIVGCLTDARRVVSALGLDECAEEGASRAV